MKTSYRNLRTVFLFCFLALCVAGLACSPNAGAAVVSLSTNSADGGAPNTQTDSNASTTGGLPGAQTGTTGALSDSFPLASDTTIDPISIDEDRPERGSFKLNSTGALSDLVDFYASTLANQGWTLRYTDANYNCSATQFWKYGDLYVTLQFLEGENGAVVQVDYDHISASSLATFSTVFPLPDNAELTSASGTSWDFYIDQDYSAVMAFYTQSSASWGLCPGYFYGSVEASCGDDDPDCGGTSSSTTCIMPTPTSDSRVWMSYCWIMSDKNQMDLTIAPHGNATILHITQTSLNADTASLPAGIQVYPGATIQSSTPGMVTFQAGASLATVQTFYEDSLAAAGWSSSGQPFAAGTAVLLNYQKGDQTIMITISDMGGNTCMVMIVVD